MNSDTTHTDVPAYRSRRTAVLVAAGYTVAAAAVLGLVDGLPSLVRVPIALPVLLLTPGYAALTALFPGGRPADDGSTDELAPHGPLPGLETADRAILAVAASVSLVGVAALAVTLLFGLTTGGVLVAVATLTVVAAAVAFARTPDGATVRRRQPSGDAGSDTSGGSTSKAYTTVTLIAVAVAVLLLVGTAVVATDDGETDPRTEFYLVEGNGTDAVAAGYPTDLTVAQRATYHLRIAQQGSSAREYTALAVLEPSTEGPEAGTTELARRAVVVQPNGTATPTVTVTPRWAGQNRTLSFLLYRGDVPADPTGERAHRRLAIQVDVAPAAGPPNSPSADPGEDDV